METVSIHACLPCQVPAFCSTLAPTAEPAHMSVALPGISYIKFHLGLGKYEQRKLIKKITQCLTVKMEFIQYVVLDFRRKQNW